MQEGQVTVEGTTFPLERPFHVIATANPIEYEGTYPLPEAQLDRFLLRVSFDYPSADDEVRVLTNRIGRGREEIEIDQVTDAAGLARAQRAVEQVAVDESVRRYCVDLTRATRTHAAGAARRLAARLARARADRARARRDRRTRLRRPRGRQGGRRRRARAPHHAAPGDVDARGVRRRPGQPGARPGAGAAGGRRDAPGRRDRRWRPSVALLSAAATVAALLFLAVAHAPPGSGRARRAAARRPRREPRAGAASGGLRRDAARLPPSTLFEDQGTVLRLSVAAPAGHRAAHRVGRRRAGGWR